MARKSTSQDVADRAGVSRSAVSFVLNGRADGNIAKDKQLRILAAAKELNYTPNAVARSLQAQRTHTIGVVTDSIAGVLSPENSCKVRAPQPSMPDTSCW